VGPSSNLYDAPPAYNDINSTIGMEVPLYVANMPTVPGVAFDSGYAETAMWNGALFNPATSLYIASVAQLQAQFATESFHMYGNNPEDYIWNQACVAANATPSLVQKTSWPGTVLLPDSGPEPATAQWWQPTVFPIRVAGFRTVLPKPGLVATVE
jgi:hypothetical protein